MKLISPQNKIIVEIEKKFYDTIEFESGVTLYQDTTFHPEEFAMMEAKVISVPRSIIDRPDYNGFKELPEEGDTILIRYDVIFSYRDQPDRATPFYKNLIMHNGQEFWRVDVLQCFAIKKEGGYRMLNNYVMCDMVELKRNIGEILVLPEHMRTEIRRDTMRVRHIFSWDIVAGQIIYTTPNAAQQYKKGIDEFYIIQQRHIQAVAL